MHLSEFLRDYAARRALSDDCLSNYRRYLNDLANFHGGSLELSELSPGIVDRWLIAKLRAGRSPYYVHSLRASILAVWCDAYRLGMANEVPAAVQIRRPDLIVRTWTPADVRALVVAARDVSGMFERIAIPRAPYLASAIAATWYAGVRRGDLHRIRYDQLQDSGAFILLQNKTGRRHVAQVPRHVIREIAVYSRPPGPIWPRPGSHELIRKVFRELVDKVRESRPKMINGCWRDIRRSAENSAERRHPGRGHLLAGHERRTFERYYRESDDIPPVAPDPLPD
jgi:hypothetical protein